MSEGNTSIKNLKNIFFVHFRLSKRNNEHFKCSFKYKRLLIHTDETPLYSQNYSPYAMLFLTIFTYPKIVSHSLYQLLMNSCIVVAVVI